jgi:hypothetical protein
MMYFVLQVGFDQFKNALIVVLSTSIVAPPAPSQETAPASLSPGKEGVEL